jgi:hypothetical protein
MNNTHHIKQPCSERINHILNEEFHQQLRQDESQLDFISGIKIHKELIQIKSENRELIEVFNNMLILYINE